MGEDDDWFIAVVWPDENGVPTGRIHTWDREAGRTGELVETVRYGTEESFAQAMARLGYLVEISQVAEPVRPHGVYVPLRREKVPVPVYVHARVPG